MRLDITERAASVALGSSGILGVAMGMGGAAGLRQLTRSLLFGISSTVMRWVQRGQDNP